jgi:hypothetical protein
MKQPDTTHPRSTPILATTLAAAALAWLAAPAPAAGQEQAEATEGPVPTQLVVRVAAHDAKLIGSGVGGARVTIRDASTGEVLAEGIQEGSTGSTARIMETPRERGDTVYATPDAAAFTTTLDLEAPTQVEITAEGPLGTPHAIQRATKSVLLLPGRDVVGEGVILELHGFTVVVEAPPADAPLSDDDSIVVRAKVEMLCGCPLTPGGMWDADRVDIRARLLRDGDVVREAPLRYSGLPSIFTVRLPPADPGEYELEVLAADPGRGNLGMARRDLSVSSSGE